MTFLMAIAVAVFGVISYTRLPVSDLPSVDYPVIQVRAAFPGMDPSTMAANVATPLEKEFLKIQGLEIATSKNLQGITSITLQFSLDKDIESAAVDVQSAIQRAMSNLPADMPSPPIFEKSDPNSQPIFFMAIGSSTLPLGQLYDYAADHLAQRFNTIEGVAKTDVYGLKRAVRIEVDPAKLSARGLTMTDVVRKIQESTATVSAGTLEGSDRSWIIRPEGQLDEAGGYADIIIAQKNGASIFLKDVASCIDGLESTKFHSSFWIRGMGTFQAVVVAVTRAAGANTVAVARELRNLLPEIRQEVPESVFMQVMHDRSERIVASIGDVQETVLIAFALVALVIFLFLGRLRDTIIPLVALPMSLLVLFVAMYLLGFSLDNLSLMAMTLAVGFLVDDAIVFLENMVRRMQCHGESPEEAATNGAREIAPTIVSMTLALASIFIPLLFLGGQVGRVFHEFSVVIIVATLASGVISLTLTPLMCANMLRPRSTEEMTRVESFSHHFEESFLRVYGRFLDFFLDRKWLSVAVWIFCLVGTVVSFVYLPKTFLPDGDSGMLFGVFLGQEGTSQRQMEIYQGRVDDVLRSNPSVQTAFSITGIPGLGSNQGIMMAFLAPSKERPEIHQMAHQIMGEMARIPGTMAFIKPRPGLQIQTGSISSNQGKYAFTVSGIEPTQVYSVAQKMLMSMRSHPSIASISSDLFLNNPEIHVRMNREQISRYGASVVQVENQLRTAYSENHAYLIKAPTQQYKVIVTAADHCKSGASDLGLLRFNGADGTLVDSATATAHFAASGPLAVNHTNNFPSATIFFDLVPGVAIGDAVRDIGVLASEIIPSGMMGFFQGEARTFAQTFASLKVLIFVAIFVTYVILGILYESYVHPLTVLSALPVAALGGFATLLIFRQQLSLYAYIGLFMLLGIVEKNGIIIIDFAIQRQREGLSPRDAVRAASLQRFRPILMTTLAMVVGVLPIALGWGASGASRRSLGLVIAGGMIFAQVITLFLTPVIYLFMDRLQRNVLDKIPLFRRGK